MAWTEQDLREIEDELKKGSQGVGDVPEAESLDGITSLPAYQEKDGEDIIVRAPLTLLAAPALEAADKANAAATKAESNATAAQTAANSANEKAGLAAQAASDANAAKEGAETATQSANNAASNAEEKAAAANTAAQDAEKIANNPTYIGKDHYVYVYNKDTESFDKTDIYCKGEPGSSFRVSGEYATLEALKSAVPDGSAVDGFMAVGTEAPYDYYAWVNGEWVSQGKIGGIDEAPTDGKAYGRKNGNWAEVPEKSDVLTKTNSESFTPTGDYQPATKKYVDDKHIMLTITDEAHIQLISNQEVKAGEAESKINLVFGSIDNFKNIIQRLLSDNILFLKITEKEIFKVSTSHTYCNPDNGAYELSFIYTYTSITDANNISLVTKRIFIALNSNATNFFVVKDILVSDNLTTLTKKTAAEYEAIGSKDDNTAYCVTDQRIMIMLKIGELTSGLFAGDKLIAGKEFDIKQLVDNITFADDLVHEEINIRLILICNLSSIPIYLYRDSVRTEIKKQYIEWYSFRAPTAIRLFNEDNTPIRAITQKESISNNFVTEITDSVVNNGDSVFDIADSTGIFGLGCVLMNA